MDRHVNNTPSHIVGIGTYGSVHLSQVAVKRYGHRSIIPHDAIREASIMTHLSSLECVPRLLSVDSYISTNQVKTTLMMELINGETLHCLIGQGSLEDRCRLAELHLDSILLAINEIHQAGVIHNDLKPDNIIINDDRVIIIDFGLSTYMDVYDTNVIEYHNPEQWSLNANTYQSDYWTLGAYILNYCLASHLDSNYVPISPTDQWDNMRSIMSQEYTIERFSNDRDIYDRVIIPDQIPESLAVKLASLLQFHRDDRHSGLSSETSLTRTAHLIHPCHHGYISGVILSLARLLIGRLTNHSSRIGVAIDLFRRSFLALQYSHIPTDVGLAIGLLVSDSRDDSRGNIRSDNNQLRVEHIHSIQLQILKSVQWRVLTYDNVRLSDDGDSIEICKKIINDRNRYQLINLSDQEIRDYFSLL